MKSAIQSPNRNVTPNENENGESWLEVANQTPLCYSCGEPYEGELIDGEYCRVCAGGDHGATDGSDAIASAVNRGYSRYKSGTRNQTSIVVRLIVEELRDTLLDSFNPRIDSGRADSSLPVTAHSL